MGKKLGLALNGGGAWGLASLGVIKAFEENKIQINYIAGCSVGALVGAAYATQFAGEKTVSKIIDILREIRLKNKMASRYNSFGWYSPEIIGQLFEENIGKFNFEDLKIPLIIVASDFKTGEEVIFDSGPITPALVATCALPLVYTPYEHRGKLLTDGGITNPLPTDIVKNMGARIILAVDTGGKQYSKRLDQKLALGHHNIVKLIPPLHYLKSRHLGSTFFQLIDLIFENYRKEKLKNAPADFLIVPNVSHHPQTAYNLVDEFVKEGERESLKVISKLKRSLK